MRKPVAAAGSVVFFLVAPGVVAGVVPWWISGWSFRDSTPSWLLLRILGVMLVVAGSGVLIHSFVRFVAEGLGTPAPVAPTRYLVVGGLYRFVRNPMYLAVIAVIVGQALLFGQVALLLYAASVAAAVVSFVRWYEEPKLARQFGTAYETYRHAVPGWWPRLRPWRPERFADRPEHR